MTFELEKRLHGFVSHRFWAQSSLCGRKGAAQSGHEMVAMEDVGPELFLPR
jgi:hypothetical protein